MCEIIDFIIENANNIKSYEISYYEHLNEDAIGEVEFFLRNGDSEIFIIC